MSEQFHSFAVDELLTITCTCPKCKNLITFNVATEEKFGLPLDCPTCRTSLGALAEALRDYREFYRTASRSGLPIRIQAKAVDPPK